MIKIDKRKTLLEEVVAKKLRESLQNFIGKKPTVDQLHAAADKVFSDWCMRKEYIVEDDVLRKSLEVTFGLTDPIELINLLETKSLDQLEKLTDLYGGGPEGMFQLVLMKRRGDIDFEVTEHRIGYLGMDVVPKYPLNYVTVTVKLENDDVDTDTQD